MENHDKINTTSSEAKRPYHKPEITSEPLCSDMALCGCDESEAKLDQICMMNFGPAGLGPS